MAKEHIEREAAINKIEEWYDMYPESDAARESLSMAKSAIRKLHAADVAPVRHGRWIKDCDRVMVDGWTYTQRHCSECGGQTVECVNYCQFCGALMDKDGDGE